MPCIMDANAWWFACILIRTHAKDLWICTQVAEHWKKSNQEAKLQLEEAQRQGKIQLGESKSREKELADQLDKTRSAAVSRRQTQWETACKLEVVYACGRASGCTRELDHFVVRASLCASVGLL